ncbi:unnamed protein product [marine sediment metagenome]|uniref:PRTase-CE domain-containing protein n=1 Tax=marine sediment metagenome TaxID=412755 RepID=X1M3Q0_9ZZZZ
MAHSFFSEKYNEINRLVTEFRGHAQSIHFESIRHWISQFDENDYDLALKLLRNIDYYTNERVLRMLQSNFNDLTTLSNWDFDKAFFSTFHKRAKSDQIIQERFRFANGLKEERYQKKFIGVTEINNLRDDPDNLFFFLEDFVGTGSTVCRNWEKTAHLMPETDNLYLVIICGHDFGIENIQNKTELKVTAGKIIPDRERFFSDYNPIFERTEQDIIMKYCEKVGQPVTGWGDCQSNVIYYSRAPNNTLPIFWKNVDNNENWQGLFKRHYDDA